MDHSGQAGPGAAPERPGPESHGQGALAGLRVLDLSRVLAGPLATQILADLGADVVKVESPAGDDTRAWGPPYLPGPERAADATYFTCCNRNKRSVVLDFTSPDGLRAAQALAARADIVVENFRVGSLRKYGLDYDSVRGVNPAVIYCSITGFGQDGPYAHRAGYDFLVQGMGGLMSFTGQPDGTPGAEPMKVGVAVCDQFTGLWAAISILAALAHRSRTGQGQWLDCNLLDSQLAMLANQGAAWLNAGVVAKRMGNSHPSVVPYRVYPARDGDLILCCGNDAQFRKLCAAFGIAEFAEDPRFATTAARVAHRHLVDARLTEIFSRHDKAEVIAVLEAAGIPGGPINDLSEVFRDPHVVARGMAVTMARSDGTAVRTVAFPARLSETPAAYRLAPPRLGEHTEEVLRSWLGSHPAQG